MEQWTSWLGLHLLLTTASNRAECQHWDWWDAADIIIRVDSRGAKVLKGEAPGDVRG